MTPSRDLSRREAIRQLSATGAAVAFGTRTMGPGESGIMVAGQPSEITVLSLSPVTARITIRALRNGAPDTISATGALEHPDAGKLAGRGGEAAAVNRIVAGDLIVRFTDGPPTIHVATAGGRSIQRVTLDSLAQGLAFTLGNGPLLGLGEGGAQFDRKGSVDRMIIGQGGYRLGTHGTRAPIQWLVGTDGWAMFIHQPYGSFDFTGTEGRFTPGSSGLLPLDLFVVGSSDPKVIMREYARITGLPEMPARWTFGYQQSHRTLGGPDEILGVARTMREKKLPCDTLIYLGTDFAPSGWNTHNGEFTWHPTNFPDPKKMIDTMHDEHFKVVLHVVLDGRHLSGSVADGCSAAPLPTGRTPDGKWPPNRQVACYWPAHKQLTDVGVDGWWPDEGDDFDGPSQLNRHRMYWEGSQLLRPNERPYALHRNASAGVQRFGGFIWSGDINTRWETLKTHVPVAINTGLSGLPYWGTDIGGFYPTAEYTAELHIRWFQFAAFCPLFRAHGRNWHLRLPWGWDGGDGGPFETGNWRADPTELHNKDVEAISRKYLELRYRLMPYLYTAVRESHDTGMPIMRAMWLHHPHDAVAVARGDQYFWGRDMLVAPVVEKGATSRKVYLPGGDWIDFWTERPVHGGQEIERAVDLSTIPVYVRAGAVIPHDPVRQYVDEPSDAPTTLVVYPGADGTSQWYDDDGKTFNYRQGESTRLLMHWDDRTRRLMLSLAPGSQLWSSGARRLSVRVAGSATPQSITFSGTPIGITLR